MGSSREEDHIKDRMDRLRAQARRIPISLLVSLSLPLLLILCCILTKFPPQIFGNNKDHFRAFVISPIPESVEILDVEFSDLIIHPDVAYYFRFVVNRSDLNKIIAYNSLQPTDDECFDSATPTWWNVPSPDKTEIYEYQTDDVIISLCYDAASSIALYSFWTY